MRKDQMNDAGCFPQEATGRSYADQREAWLSGATKRDSAYGVRQHGDGTREVGGSKSRQVRVPAGQRRSQMAVRQYRPAGLTRTGALRAVRDTSAGRVAPRVSGWQLSVVRPGKEPLNPRNSS